MGAPLRAEVATSAPSRVALVIGESAYRGGPLPAAPDDAGLVAQVLAGAGFDVTGARDLDGDGLRRAFRDFLDKAAAAGPDGIAVVYVAGRAIQSDGDDYIVPVDARLARPADVPIEALRLADFTHALAALPIQARVVVVDGAYGGVGATAGSATAPGLALLEAEQGELLAFNAAPGTVAPPTSGPYGTYAQALVATVKQGGVPVGEVFARVRLAVNQATRGAVIPWHSDKLTRSFTFFDRAADSPALASAQIPFASLEKRPLRDFPADQAYDVAVARDTLPAYADFLAAFPDDPLARRVRLIVSLRREALFWRAAVQGNVPGAYWTYLVRYPKGPHVADARRRLTRLAAAAAPPPRFVPLAFDVPPPGVDDVPVDRVIVFDAPGLPPPPPPPVFLLPPPVVIVIERPAQPAARGLLPVPVPVAIPFVRPPIDPGSIAPPRGVPASYPHPRPYARGANGDGLVVQAAPVASPPAAATPATGHPPAAVSPGAPARSPGPQPDPATPARPDDRSDGGARPASPPIARPSTPGPAPLPVPAGPTPPVVKPVTGPGQPRAPVAPVPPTPPAAGRPAPAPAGLPETSRPARRDRPVSPRPAAPEVPVATPPDAKPDAPAAHKAPHHPAADPAARPDSAAKPEAAPPSEPKRAPSASPSSSAPRATPAPPRPQGAAAPPGAPGPRHPAPGGPAPEHPAGSLPRPTAPDRAGPAGPRPAGQHPVCGHPGEPPCRP